MPMGLIAASWKIIVVYTSMHIVGSIAPVNGAQCPCVCTVTWSIEFMYQLSVIHLQGSMSGYKYKSVHICLYDTLT